MVDHVLAVLLLAVVPARALLRDTVLPRASQTKSARYGSTILLVGALLAILGWDWWSSGRSLTVLGLAAPTSLPAMSGLLAAGALLAVLLLAARRSPAGRSAKAAPEGLELMPATPGELRLFLVFAASAGLGWEVLYRGFLLLYLPPFVGLPGAVAIAAVSYGVAHGFKGWRRLAGSIVSALAFAIGYAATWNLWWLVLLHMGLPLVGLLASRSRTAARPVGGGATL